MMDRLQKKCLIAAVTSHGLLVTLLIVGPAFFISPDRLDPHQTITVIPDTVSDGPTQIHGQATPSDPAPAPAPASQVVQPPQPVRPPLPTPVNPPPRVTPNPARSEFEPALPATRGRSGEFRPAVRPTPSRSNTSTPPSRNPNPQASAENARKIAAINARLNALANSIGKGAPIQMPQGTSDDVNSVANYGDLVYSIYQAAWTKPLSSTDANSTVLVSVTIARNGNVIKHEILKPSGNATMDKSIERTLENVTFVKEFPDGATDSERTFQIQFNLQSK